MSSLAQLEQPIGQKGFILGELPNDELVRMQAQEFILAVGQLATRPNSTFNRGNPEVEGIQIDSLYDALPLAADGDKTAIDMIDSNVRTDVVERVYKTGMIIEVELDSDETGNSHQHGQSIESVQANTLLFASASSKIAERSRAEVNNAFRIKHYLKEDLLDDNVLVVISHVPDNMSDAEAADAGFFVETMSLSIQITHKVKGKVVTESLFVSGKDADEGERFDLEAGELFAAKLGADYKGLTTTQKLDKPILVPKNLLPNGAVDAAEVWDDCVEQVTTKESFFGQFRPKEDYPLYRDQCRRTQEKLEPTVQQIRDELISERQTILSEVAAIKRLNKLSEKHMVVHAVMDTEVNPDVFGEESAFHIIMARLHIENGNYELAEKETLLGQETADSSSCPSALKEDDKEDCEFNSLECPLCGAKNVLTKVSRITSKIKKIEGKCGCSTIITN